MRWVMTEVTVGEERRGGGGKAFLFHRSRVICSRAYP